MQNYNLRIPSTRDRKTKKPKSIREEIKLDDKFEYSELDSMILHFKLAGMYID